MVKKNILDTRPYADLIIDMVEDYNEIQIQVSKLDTDETMTFDLNLSEAVTLRDAMNEFINRHLFSGKIAP